MGRNTMTDKTVQDSPVMDATQEAILNVLRGDNIVHDVPILYHAGVIEGRAGYLRQALPSAALVASPDRKRVVSGKRVSVRVNHGSRRIIKKKNYICMKKHN